jgi:hypothetical protein
MVRSHFLHLDVGNPEAIHFAIPFLPPARIPSLSLACRFAARLGFVS